MNRTTIAAAAALFVLASCSDASTTATTTTTTAADVPERIVSLSPTATETLFAVGAGDQVVAVDDTSTYPASAPTTDLSAYEPSVEAIAAYEPDLVVLADDAGGIADQLEALDIEVVVAPAAADLDDAYDQVRELGEQSGHAEEADALADAMEDEIADLAASVPERAEPLTFVHELDPTLYTATSSTFIGQVYELLGLENVADAADPDGTAGGYPQLSAEFLVDADPDLVFLADTRCCEQDAASFGQRPGFGELRAVRDGAVVELDDDIASRWGPRLVDFVAAIVDALASIPTS